MKITIEVPVRDEKKVINAVEMGVLYLQIWYGDDCSYSYQVEEDEITGGLSYEPFTQGEGQATPMP